MTALPALERFTADTDAELFRIPMVVFPNGFIAYSYLLLGQGAPTLIDCGSGFPDSDKHLIDGLNAIADEFRVPFALPDIERIFITHGHIDHFGGVANIAELADAAWACTNWIGAY